MVVPFNWHSMVGSLLVLIATLISMYQYPVVGNENIPELSVIFVPHFVYIPEPPVGLAQLLVISPSLPSPVLAVKHQTSWSSKASPCRELSFNNTPSIVTPLPELYSFIVLTSNVLIALPLYQHL